MIIAFVDNPGLDLVISSVVFVVMLSAGLVIREVARARVGAVVGDHIPTRAGRTQPSIRRIYDPLGSIFFPLFTSLLGSISYSWATPLPYDVGNPGPRKQVVASSLAGPAANLVFAAVAGFLVDVPRDPNLFETLVAMFILANVSLAVMHLLPVPPLDGARILASFLSSQARASYQRVEPWGIAILFAIAFLGRLLRFDEIFAAMISALLRLVI